jgi:hypothetical protein
MISLRAAATLATLFVATVQSATPTTGFVPQTSPAWLPPYTNTQPVITQWPPANANAALPSGPLPSNAITFTGYPTTNQPIANAASDPNIIAVMKTIDWTKVPNAPVTNDTYAATYPTSDPYCWWYVTKKNLFFSRNLPEGYF